MNIFQGVVTPVFSKVFSKIVNTLGGLVYSLPSTVSEYISLGNLTDARATSGTVTDFEGITRTIPAGTPLREGCRVVENLCTAPNDLTDTGFWSELNSANVLNATQWQNDASLNAAVRSPFLTGFQIGDAFRVHCKIAVADKSVASEWRIGFYQQGGGNGGYTNITSQLSDQEQWITSDVGTITTLGTSAYFVVHAVSPTGVTTITQSEFFIEKVNGQANQNPSSIVDGLAYSDYENGNTVVSNVVVPGLGAAVSNPYWLHDSVKNTSIQEAFANFPQDAGTLRVVFSPQFNLGAVLNDNGVGCNSSVANPLYFGGSGHITSTDQSSYPTLGTLSYSSGDRLEVVVRWGNGTFNVTGQNITTASGWLNSTEVSYDGDFPSDGILRIFADQSAETHIYNVEIYKIKLSQAAIEAGM